jgi:hypothetical protein
MLEHSLRQVFTKMWRYVVRNQQDNQERRPTSTKAAETCAQVRDKTTSLSSSTDFNLNTTTSTTDAW